MHRFLSDHLYLLFLAANDSSTVLSSEVTSAGVSIESAMDKAAARYEKTKRAPVRSMLEILETANVSELDRDRKTKKSKHANSDKPFHKPQCKSNPRTIEVNTRLEEKIRIKYKDEVTGISVDYECLVGAQGLTNHLGTLFCSVCKQEVSMVKGTIALHCVSKKHRRNKLLREAMTQTSVECTSKLWCGLVPSDTYQTASQYSIHILMKT